MKGQIEEKWFSMPRYFKILGHGEKVFVNMPRDKGKYEVLVERAGHSGDVFLYTPRK